MPSKGLRPPKVSIDKQLRRATMTPEDRKLRRELLRIRMGLFSKTGWEHLTTAPRASRAERQRNNAPLASETTAAATETKKAEQANRKGNQVHKNHARDKRPSPNRR